jgi:hypothetical protein
MWNAKFWVSFTSFFLHIVVMHVIKIILGILGVLFGVLFFSF